jgi:Predicted nucleotide-binding protein containing TIR-like domain
MIDACDGGLVLGLARWRFELADRKQHRVPTESGHFEGALSLRRGIPTLILCEQTMWDRGIYYNGGGSYIHKFPLEAPLEWLRTPLFIKAFDEWVAAIKRRPLVFIGSCGNAQTLVNELIAYLSGSLGVTFRHYSSGFTPGASLLDEIRRASAECSLGIFVFTKDDPLEGRDGLAAPRDNVVFEAGFFAAARGHERVLVILEDGAKLPADMGGAIYVRLPDQRSLASIHTSIRQFIEARL